MATDTRRPRADRPCTVLRGVKWTTYLELRLDPRNDRVRMSYLDGMLILMSPEYIHDSYAWLFAKVVDEVCEALDIPARATVSTTLRRKGPGPRKGSGKEPDFGFYFRENEPRMRNKATLDLEVDPPPDLAIEVDNKADSARALPLYARIGVPEVWRFKVRSRRLWFGRLVGEAYEEIDRSLNLPKLTPTLVLHALGQFEGMGQTAWKRWLRDWARGLPEPPAVL